MNSTLRSRSNGPFDCGADYRDCELQASNRLPASVWSYLYHEYAAPFQSNPKRGNRWMQAHCAVDGQTPCVDSRKRHRPGPVG